MWKTESFRIKGKIPLIEKLIEPIDYFMFVLHKARISGETKLGRRTPSFYVRFMPLGQRFQALNAISTSRSGVFIVNFEHISHLVLVFLLLTLNR